MSEPSGAEILDQAEKISSLIATARALMADGKSVDLSNLEGKISALCEIAQSAEQQQLAPVRAALSDLLEDLNRLDDEVTRNHAGAGGATLENTIKRAIDAYNLDSEEN